MIDKRVLKQQYLETKTHAGVYAIRNLVNGRRLIAGSNNARAAVNRHRFELQVGSHSNRLLKADWQEFGEAAFEFQILDTVKHRDEPGFNVATELSELVSLWREEIGCPEDLDYQPPGKPK